MQKGTGRIPLVLDGEAGALILENPSERDVFNRMFEGQREVSLYSLHYHARMSVLAWEIMLEIADDPLVLVKDDSGAMTRGADLAAELNQVLSFKRTTETS